MVGTYLLFQHLEETETGGPGGVQRYPWLYIKFEASLGYLRPVSKDRGGEESLFKFIHF